MSVNYYSANFRQLIGTVILAFATLLVSTQAEVRAQQPQNIAPSPVFLSIESQSGIKRFVVEIADEQAEREVGLMFRNDMPLDQGMLFDFGIDRLVTMWMRNTPLSLDMIFIDRSGSIVRIAPNTTPFSTDIISSGQPVRYVLELNAGVALANGIRSGDQVMHPLIKKNLNAN